MPLAQLTQKARNERFQLSSSGTGVTAADRRLTPSTSQVSHIHPCLRPDCRQIDRVKSRQKARLFPSTQSTKVRLPNRVPLLGATSRSMRRGLPCCGDGSSSWSSCSVFESFKVCFFHVVQKKVQASRNVSAIVINLAIAHKALDEIKWRLVYSCRINHKLKKIQE